MVASMMPAVLEPLGDARLPAGSLPSAHVLSAALIDGEVGIRRAVRARATDELETMVKSIPHYRQLCAAWLDALQVTQPPSSFWTGVVLPAIKAELTRRRKPDRPQGKGRIAQIKAKFRLEDVAARFTTLIPAGGGKLKGCCPLHPEKTPSFFVYTEQQTWR